jgi:hypothetical protein
VIVFAKPTTSPSEVAFVALRERGEGRARGRTSDLILRRLEAMFLFPASEANDERAVVVSLPLSGGPAARLARGAGLIAAAGIAITND